MKVEVDEVCFSRAVAEPACAGQLLDLIASVKKLGHLLITLPPFSRDGDSGVNILGAGSFTRGATLLHRAAGRLERSGHFRSSAQHFGQYGIP